MGTSDKNQIEKFREAARELETDDDEERFDATLKRLARPAPAKDDEPSDRKKVARNED